MQSTLSLDALFETLDALFISCKQDEVILKIQL